MIKRFLSRLKHNQDGKRVASNFGYLVVLQFAGYLFPLLTIPYLARVIGVEKIGDIAFAAAIILWFKTITEWGFNYTATRDIARCRDNVEETSQILSNVLWARVFLGLICFLILYLASEWIPALKERQAIILVTFLLIPGDIIFPVWFFQALERMKYITILQLLAQGIFTGSIFLFVKSQEDYIMQPMLLALGSITSGCIALYLIYCKWGYRLYKPRINLILKVIKSSKDVFLNQIIPNLYNSFSTVLLGFFHGSTANGLLDAGTKFTGVARRFLDVLSRAFFPFLSRKINYHNIYVLISISISAIFSICLFLLAPLIIKIFYTEEFYEAVIALKILSFSIVFLSLSNIFGVNYLILKGFERELRNTTLIFSILGFISAWPLIYFFDFIGAALTITGTRVLLGLAIMIQALKKDKKQLNPQ